MNFAISRCITWNARTRAEAIAILEKVVPTSEQKLGAEDAQTFVAFFNLADAYRMSERHKMRFSTLRRSSIVGHRSPETNHLNWQGPSNC